MGELLPPVPDQIGTYEILDRVGQGATGDVLKALSPRGDGVVAVKRLKPSLRHKPKSVERFRREFEAMRLLDHPAIVKAFDAGTDGQTLYLVMEYVSERHIGDLAAGLTESERLSVVLQVASALDYAHNSGIVHRDLKPTNILVAQRDPLRVKLADFGIARMVLEDYTTLTDSGAILGTLSFLAPEQLMGERADYRCDLYALGVLIYVLWAGALPFTGPLVKQIRGRLQSEAPRLSVAVPGIMPQIDTLVAQLLEREPVSRPDSAEAVAQTLWMILGSVDRELADSLAGYVG